VTLNVDTPEGVYDLRTGWVVAADGGRSPMRRMMGLRMEGRSYSGNFVIADIKADIPLPTERLCHFDPDWNPGNNVLVHREPDGIWRLDFRLPDGETAEEALEEGRLAKRIDLILAMIGHKVPWTLDWATVYSANTLTLTDYVHGRVVFTGDAAHLLPIFGVRGANTGFQDGDNLAWKLAAVVKGEAPPRLLASYSSERVEAAQEICEEAGKSTRFMTPPTAGFRLMRDAVLSFALSEDFAKDLLHWRTSRPHVYAHSPLNSFPDEDAAFAGGPATGATLANVKLGHDDFLLDHLRSGFHLLVFAGGSEGNRKSQAEVLAAAPRADAPVVRVLVAADRAAAAGLEADIVILDPSGAVARKYAAGPGTAYLARPDLHVCARWLAPRPDQIIAAVATALQRP
jgi:3-(3-hydroxy-phenyl)propionate hydroxylase